MTTVQEETERDVRELLDAQNKLRAVAFRRGNSGLLHWIADMVGELATAIAGVDRDG